MFWCVQVVGISQYLNNFNSKQTHENQKQKKVKEAQSNIGVGSWQDDDYHSFLIDASGAPTI